MKNIFWPVVLAVIVVAGLGYWWWQSGEVEPLTNDTDIQEMTFGNDNIFLNDFIENQSISSPLVLSGEAVGPWYFEADFPIELKDGNGTTIATTIAEAQSDWMVSTLVPFVATLTFVTPTTSTGTLILHKDNPSGLPANDDELVVPVTF